jgi:hypothetical protein
MDLTKKKLAQHKQDKDQTLKTISWLPPLNDD